MVQDFQELFYNPNDRNEDDLGMFSFDESNSYEVIADILSSPLTKKDIFDSFKYH